MWRSGLGFGLHPCQGFPVRGPIVGQLTHYAI